MYFRESLGFRDNESRLYLLVEAGFNGDVVENSPFARENRVRIHAGATEIFLESVTRATYLIV